MPEDIAARLDKLAIQEVIVRYSDAASRGAWDVFETLWTHDAVWEVAPPVGTTVVGARAITEATSETIDQEDFLIQVTHGSVVTLHGGGLASATTTIHALARREGHHSFMNFGIYYDELAKTDGEWRFTRRRLQPVYVESGPLPGEVVISRADLR